MDNAKIFNQILRAGFALATCIPFACSNPSGLVPLDDSRKLAIEAAAESQLREDFARLRIGGVMTNHERYDSLGQTFCVAPSRDTIFDYDDLRANALESAQLMDSISAEWLTLNVHALSEDVATFEGTVHGFSMTRPWTINKPSTRDTSISNSIESGTLIRRGDRWKIVGVHSEDLLQ